MSDILKEMRATMNATTNAGGVDPAFDSVEIQAKIDQMLIDASPKFSELRNMIPRQSLNGQPTFLWNVRTSDNGSTRWAYTFSENVVTSNTNSGTALQGAKVQLTATAKSVRTDWEVENFFRLASASYYDAVSDEVSNALKVQIDKEEKQIVTGTAASGYGDANGFLGLRQIVNSYVTIGDTTTVFGIQRASGKTYLDAQVVDAANAAISSVLLDKAITACKKRGAIPGFFVMSYDQKDVLDASLQSQQRFMGSMNIAGGFSLATYKGVPIVLSRYMDKAGESNTDTKVFLIAQDNLVMKTLLELTNKEANLGRADAVGGYIQAYEALVCPRLDANVVINAIATP